MAQSDTQLSQTNFMLRGGMYEMPMQMLRKAGILQTDYVYKEYPKLIRLSRGTVEVEKSTEDCKGRLISWKETVEQFDDVIVNSEEEEERVIAGGKTTTQIEADRMGLLSRCRSMGIAADPSWSAVRLRRELGEALDAPAPADNMAKLEAELANLRKMAAMQAEIEALRAQLATPVPMALSDETVDDLRSQLTELGVKVDRRWSVGKLREELDNAINGG